MSFVVLPSPPPSTSRTDFNLSRRRGRRAKEGGRERGSYHFLDYGGGGGDSDSATADSQIHQTDGGPSGSGGEGGGGDIAVREEKYKPRRESDLARWKQKVKLK